MCSTQAGPLSSTAGLKPSSLVNVSLLFHYLSSQATHCAPYSALQRAFKLVPATLSGPAFVIPAPSSRGLIPFTYAKFDSLLKSVASTAGLDPSRISCHSLHSGGATLAFQANISEEFIKRLGDWRSDAFKSYIHIPLSIECMLLAK